MAVAEEGSPRPRVRLVYDHRERGEAHALRILEKDPDVELVPAVMEIGDFELAPGRVVERKGAADWCSSIIDRRLFKQVEAAKESGVEVTFLIEGDIFKAGEARNMHPNAIAGALSWVTVIERMPVVTSMSAGQTAALLKTMVRHATDGLGYVISIKPPKPKQLPDLQGYLVQSLPGLGIGKTRAALKLFGSPMGVFRATAAELCQVDRMGSKTAAEIRRILDSRYEG